MIEPTALSSPLIVREGLTYAALKYKDERLVFHKCEKLNPYRMIFYEEYHGIQDREERSRWRFRPELLNKYNRMVDWKNGYIAGVIALNEMTGANHERS